MSVCSHSCVTSLKVCTELNNMPHSMKNDVYWAHRTHGVHINNKTFSSDQLSLIIICQPDICAHYKPHIIIIIRSRRIPDNSDTASETLQNSLRNGCRKMLHLSTEQSSTASKCITAAVVLLNGQGVDQHKWTNEEIWSTTKNKKTWATCSFWDMQRLFNTNTKPTIKTTLQKAF